MKRILEKTYKLDALSRCEGMIKNIIKLYEQEKRTLTYIAVRYNMSVGTVKQILMDNNVKLRSKNDKGYRVKHDD